MLFYPEDITKPITPDYQVGLKWIGDSGEQFETLPRDNNDKEITIKLSSWMGISIGAMHYYAKIHVDTPRIISNGDKKRSHCGYVGKNKPEELNSLDLDARRKLTKVEKDVWDEVIGKIGEMTYRFNDAASAAIAAFKLVKEKFIGDWTVRFEGIRGGEISFSLKEIKPTKDFYLECEKRCEECYE